MLCRDDQSIAYTRTKPACSGRSHPTRRLADRETYVGRPFAAVVVRTFRFASVRIESGILIERAIDERAGIDRTKGGMDNRQ